MGARRLAGMIAAGLAVLSLSLGGVNKHDSKALGADPIFLSLPLPGIDLREIIKCNNGFPPVGYAWDYPKFDDCYVNPFN